MREKKVSEKGIPCGARKKMPLWYSLAWSSRGIAAALNVILVGYVSFYASDVLGLSVGIIGTALLLSKIIDAFTDLGIGFLIDKTHSRWGKARPYEIFIILQWVFTVLLFSVPSIGKTGQYVYIFIMYVMINAICTTALGGSDSVYLARTFSTDNNRIKVMSVNGVVVMLCSIVFNIVAPQFIQQAGTSKAGWSTLALSMGIPLAIIGMLRFFLCKELPQKQEQSEAGAAADTKESKQTNSLSFKEMLSALGKNKYLFLLVGLMLITNIINNLGPAATYYFKYMVGDIGALSIANMTAVATPFLLILFPMLSRKIGTTRILQIASALGVVGMIIRTIGGINMATIMVGGLFNSVAVLPVSMMINTYLIDCMDYGEWKTGSRIEGLIASIVNFSAKVGQGVAAGLLGLIMGIAGYNGSLAAQSATANTAIIAMYNILPMILYAMMFIISMMYKMDKFRPKMQAELKVMHGETEDTPSEKE